jgi:hypothetical protein
VGDKRLELLSVSKTTLHIITTNFWFIYIYASLHKLMVNPYRDKYRDYIVNKECAFVYMYHIDSYNVHTLWYDYTSSKFSI